MGNVKIGMMRDAVVTYSCSRSELTPWASASDAKNVATKLVGERFKLDLRVLRKSMTPLITRQLAAIPKNAMVPIDSWR